MTSVMGDATIAAEADDTGVTSARCGRLPRGWAPYWAGDDALLLRASCYYNCETREKAAPVLSRAMAAGDAADEYGAWQEAVKPTRLMSVLLETRDSITRSRGAAALKWMAFVEPVEPAWGGAALKRVLLAELGRSWAALRCKPSVMPV